MPETSTMAGLIGRAGPRLQPPDFNHPASTTRLQPPDFNHPTSTTRLQPPGFNHPASTSPFHPAASGQKIGIIRQTVIPVTMLSGMPIRMKSENR